MSAPTPDDLGTMGCRLRPDGQKTWCGRVPLVPQGAPADGEHCDERDERLAFVIADVVAVAESRPTDA